MRSSVSTWSGSSNDRVKTRWNQSQITVNCMTKHEWSTLKPTKEQINNTFEVQVWILKKQVTIWWLNIMLDVDPRSIHRPNQIGSKLVIIVTSKEPIHQNFLGSRAQIPATPSQTQIAIWQTTQTTLPHPSRRSVTKFLNTTPWIKDIPRSLFCSAKCGK